MELTIDGRKITVQPGQSLLEAVKALGLLTGRLSTDPLAAKIAGEVFTLNYIPVRQQEVSLDQPSMRRAMAASGGVVKLLRYSDPTGKDAYTRTAQFVLFLALEQLWPQARARMDCTVGQGLYVLVRGVKDFSAKRLKEHVRKLVAEDIPLRRCRWQTEEAIRYFAGKGQTDKADLLRWRPLPYFDVYTHADFADYYYGEMAPSTGFLRVWDIREAKDGLLFIFPDDADPDRVADHQEMPNFQAVCTEGERWCELMACQTVADLNKLVLSGQIRDLIRVNEALHEKRYSQVADRICRVNAQAVMLAGPSSSGKTTSANRLATQLKVHGKRPVLLSLDDYYLDRDQIPVGPDGKRDFEHIDTIDTALFGKHLVQLLGGAAVELPSFDFKSGKRRNSGHTLQLREDSVIIIEGLHALNPVLLPPELDRSRVFRLYVSPLLPLNLDDHNRIPTSLLRLLRRIVRDYETRGTSVEGTIAMWDSVRRGEKRWIFPFQESADVIFNSSTLYELAVLKKHIFPLLTQVPPEDPSYDSVQAIVRILNFVREADVDDEIPPTSLVREFIGGNAFYR